jgi:hypothetical protein
MLVRSAFEASTHARVANSLRLSAVTQAQPSFSFTSLRNLLVRYHGCPSPPCRTSSALRCLDITQGLFTCWYHLAATSILRRFLFPW